MRPISVLGFALMMAASILLTGCAGASPGERELELAPLSEMPVEIRQAPTTVQEAYRFAVANPDLISQFPCYCGCSEMGHMSNLDCYVQENHSDGTILFDDHALG